MGIALFWLGAFLSTLIAAMWHGVEMAEVTGRHRRMHLAVVAATFLTLIALGFSAPEPITRAIGAALSITGMGLAAMEVGRGRALCVFSIGFGGLVALGLPYALG